MLLQYDEKVDVAPEIFMRYASHGLRDAQRKTQLVHRTKLVQSSDGRNFPLVDTTYGDDVDVIKLVTDPYNAEIYPQTRVWHQDTWELAQRGHNEFPRDFSQWKRGTVPPGGNLGGMSGFIENRVYWRLNHETITVYPSLPPNSEVTLYYTVYFHPFSSTVVQWAGWFPLDTNFLAQFTTTPLPNEVDRLVEAIILYAVWMTMSSRRHPLSADVRQQYMEVIADIISSIPNDAIGLVSPYRIYPL